MNEKEIRLKLNKIESWMMMTCESCAMPEKILPLVNDIRKLLDEEEKSKSGETPASEQQLQFMLRPENKTPSG